MSATVTLNGTINARGNVIINNSTSTNQTTNLKKLHKNLHPVDNAAYDAYVSKAEKCFEGTRVQVLKDIWAWIHGEGNPASVYILDGVAGIGKSTVAQTIAHQAASRKILGASYFFTRDEEERMTTRRFVPTIAYQLAVNQKEYAPRITTAFNDHPDVAKKNLGQQLGILVLDPLREAPMPGLSQEYPRPVNVPQAPFDSGDHFPAHIAETEEDFATPILIVIDALDECNVEEAKNLLRLLIGSCHTVARLRVLITTRPEFNIRQVLHSNNNHERFRLHDIEDLIVQADIRLYIESCLTPSEIQKSLANSSQSWQPSARDLNSLCKICGTLFIIASTALKFILDPRRSNPKRQLLRLLDGVTENVTVSQRTDAMDKIYLHVLVSACPEDDDQDEQEDWMDLYQTVVGALIALQYPLPRLVLAKLLDVDENDIDRTLVDLHALVAPKGPDEVFRIHHKTFPDFITNQRRIGKALRGLSNDLHTDATMFLIDTKAHHAKLAKHCFGIMKAKLKQNICDLSPHDSYKDNANVQHLLPSGISGPELAYACTQWAYHFNAGTKDGQVDDELKGCLDAWQSSQLLAWLEMLSILGKVDMADHILATAIRTIATLSGSWPTSKSIVELLNDACKLVARNRDIIKLSSTHIHWSLPPFIPTNTLLYNNYKHSGNGLKLVTGGEKSWGYAVAILQGHSDCVMSIAFSSDGSRLASASNDKTVRLWDGRTGAHIATIEGHMDPVTSVAFSGDGSRLASASEDETVRLWDGSTGTHIATLEGHTYSVTSVAFSGDGSRLASASNDKTVRLWNGSTGAHIATLEGHSSNVRSVAFSSDGSRLASASNDKTVRLWDGSTGTHIATLGGHSSNVRSVAFSSDGSRLASASYDKTVRLWDGSTGTHIATLEGHSAWVGSVAFSSDGSRLASASNDETVRLWDGRTGAHIAALEGHSGGVYSVAFSVDGSRLASASFDMTVQLWDGSTGAHIATLEGHLDAVDCVTFSSDGSRLASAGDYSVRLWNASTDIHTATLEGHSHHVRSVTFSSDGSRLASASNDKTVRLWDGSTGTHIATLEGHTYSVTSVAFSGDGSRLASASYDKTVRLWDGSTGALIAALEGHSDSVNSVAFSSDGLRLASASGDKTVRLWDGSTGALIAALEGHSDSVNSVAFSSDGSRLASASWDNTVQLWDGSTGAHIATLVGHSGIVISVAFSSNGSRLASASHNNTVRLWDGKTGAPLHTFTHDSIFKIHAIAYASGKLPSIPICANCLFALVQRKQPKLFGLVAMSEGPGGGWHNVPFLWFPAHLELMSLAVSTNGSIAVGCKNGRVLILDISNAVFP